MVDNNKNIYVSYWLLLITFLVSLMIVVGGLTRLTDSGLSITNWDLFTGIFPPLTKKDWESFFDLYKQIPEFQLINSTMTLDQFKIIFYWEYIHRLLGRVVGLLYLFPLIFFTYKKFISKEKLFLFYFIFLLILLQGFVGWYMVQSGLTERTDVSHYRLSLHLTIAFIILILLFWNYLQYINKKKFISSKKFPKFFLSIFLFFVFLQISLGALVSGLDAGQVYQTWPYMNQNYFPDDSSINDLFSKVIFETPSLVQFLHRNLAYFIILLFSLIAVVIFKYNEYSYLRKYTLIVFFSILFQVLLGILTLLSGAQIILASMHQIGSIVVVLTSVILVFKNSKIN